MYFLVAVFLWGLGLHAGAVEDTTLTSCMLAVQSKLAARGMTVGSLHGELDKQERQKVLKSFRDGKSGYAFIVLWAAGLTWNGLAAHFQ